jgi:hypothetical protein
LRAKTQYCAAEVCDCCYLINRLAFEIEANQPELYLPMMVLSATEFADGLLGDMFREARATQQPHLVKHCERNHPACKFCADFYQRFRDWYKPPKQKSHPNIVQSKRQRIEEPKCIDSTREPWIFSAWTDDGKPEVIYYQACVNVQGQLEPVVQPKTLSLQLHEHGGVEVDSRRLLGVWLKPTGQRAELQAQPNVHEILVERVLRWQVDARQVRPDVFSILAQERKQDQALLLFSVAASVAKPLQHDQLPVAQRCTIVQVKTWIRPYCELASQGWVLNFTQPTLLDPSARIVVVEMRACKAGGQTLAAVRSADAPIFDRPIAVCDGDEVELAKICKQHVQIEWPQSKVKQWIYYE